MYDNAIDSALKEVQTYLLQAHEQDAAHPISFDALAEAIASLAKATKLCNDNRMSAQLSTVDLADGDLLVVKLGNPATGWLPSPEDGERSMELVQRALAAADLDVTVLLHHYGLDLSAYRKVEQ